MDDQFRKFISGALHTETISDFPTVRELALGRRDDRADQIRSEFAQLLRERSLDTDEWYRLTYVEFDDENHLYTFLQQLYAYLYEDGAEPSELPE